MNAPCGCQSTVVNASYLVGGDEDILGMDDPPVKVLNPARFAKLWRPGSSEGRHL